ncbi:MAG: ribonuclease III [Nitrospiraceae bacterium]|nr:ribonuclease III [Nitrospiraceae bacterium]
MTSPASSREASDLERKIGYHFRDRDLLSESLTHKSFYHENKGKTRSYNERLEFLGDSVVGLVVVEYLFLLGERYEESVLAKMKSFLVCEAVLAEIASSVSLGRHILLGKGEESTGGRAKKSILADVFEAVIGAVYLDSGYEKTRQVVLRFFEDRVKRAIESGEFYDFKTELQEKTQSLYGILPEYKVIKEEGEEHQRIFTVAVFLEGRRLASASGKRKKEAEARAAKKAIEKVKE